MEGGGSRAGEGEQDLGALAGVGDKSLLRSSVGT